MMSNCTMCPRACNVDRIHQRGICLAPMTPVVSKIMLHQWEEPFLTGRAGSGAIFFSGCNLRCVYCQNHTISHRLAGREMTSEELIGWMLRLQAMGAANINLVTASHYAEQLAPILRDARAQGLDLPILWNSSAYESVRTLAALEGLVDIYLPDFKYMDPTLARRYSMAEDYPQVARSAIAEMVRQTGPLRFQDDQLVRGTVIRHLVLPGMTEDAQAILAYLHQTYGSDVFLSIMNQYTPAGDLKDYPEIDRHVSANEYEEVVDYAMAVGITQAMIQSDEAQSTAFTPDFTILFEEATP